MLREFNFLRKLGEGSFGSVFLVRRISDSQLYALKKVQILGLNEKDKQNALNEIRLLASVRHANVIQYKESFLDVNSHTLCLVMEYAEKGDILQKIEHHYKRHTTFPEYELWSAIIQSLCGLKALHDLNVMHRDIKCANILVSGAGELKLADFNVSKVVSHKEGFLHTQTGTPYYASPEVWKDRPYDFKSDIWSLGCVLYEMASLRPPFKAKDMAGLYRKVVQAQYPPISTRYSPEFREIISLMLQPNPNLRPSSEQLLSLPIMVERMQQLKVFDKNVEACFTQLKALDFFNLPLQLQQQQIREEYMDVSPDRATQSGALLNTIKLPRILRQLTDRLPKPNYESSLALKSEQHDAKKDPNSNKHQTPLRSPRKSHSDKKHLVSEQHHITPQMNSTKFAALDMMQNQAMRPTSSRVGNFLPKTNTQTETNQKAVQEHQHRAYLPANLPSIDRSDASGDNSQSHRDHLAKINTNKQEQHMGGNMRPPLSQRGNPQGQNKRHGNDELLPLVMLNPPIALFEAEDRQRFQPGVAAYEGPSKNQQQQQQQQSSNYYPDFLRENQEMTDQVNQVIADGATSGHKRNRAAYQAVSYDVYKNSPEVQQRHHNHRRGQPANEKENNNGLPHHQHRKISARRVHPSSPQGAVAPLESISVNLSPPQAQQQHYRNKSNKFSVRKLSNHQRGTNSKQHRSVIPSSKQQSPSHISEINSLDKENISLRVSTEQMTKRNGNSQGIRGEPRDYRHLRQSNSLVDALPVENIPSKLLARDNSVGSVMPALSTVEVPQGLRNKLQSHMYRRNGSRKSQRELQEQQKSYEDSVKQVQIIVEDVEKKINQMQKQNSAKYDLADSVQISSPRSKVTKGVSQTKAPSLDMIRKEVKAALTKVSSSVDFGNNYAANQANSRQNLLSQHQHFGESDEVRVQGESSQEERQAIEHLKKARQLRRL